MSQIVFNPSSYPNFLSFLDWKGVAYIPTNMTFSVSRDRGAFEWAGTNLSTVFCQLQNIVSLGMWRMIWDVVRFNVCARRFLYDKALSKDGSISIGEFLVNEGFSGEFRDNYLIVSAYLSYRQHLIFTRHNEANDCCDMVHATRQMRS
jgi:predicted NAD/FAD-binding protein